MVYIEAKQVGTVNESNPLIGVLQSNAPRLLVILSGMMSVKVILMRNWFIRNAAGHATGFQIAEIIGEEIDGRADEVVRLVVVIVQLDLIYEVIGTAGKR